MMDLLVFRVKGWVMVEKGRGNLGFLEIMKSFLGILFSLGPIVWACIKSPRMLRNTCGHTFAVVLAN